MAPVTGYVFTVPQHQYITDRETDIQTDDLSLHNRALRA